jgi:hypothetical protein
MGLMCPMVMTLLSLDEAASVAVEPEDEPLPQAHSENTIQNPRMNAKSFFIVFPPFRQKANKKIRSPAYPSVCADPVACVYPVPSGRLEQGCEIKKGGCRKNRSYNTLAAAWTQYKPNRPASSSRKSHIL